MIRPIDFLWRQLNGPQITAFTQGVYKWCVNQFDDLLDYYNDLKIKNANSAHLNLFGMMANFARPFIRVVDMTFFWFTTEPEENFDHGFSSLENLSAGGIFSSVSRQWESEHGVPLSDAFFRRVLQAYSDSEGEIGSLTLLDDLCNTLKEYAGTSLASYDINILTELQGVMDVGDIQIDIGALSHWENWASVVAAIEALTKTVYAPLPRVHVTYTSVE